MAFDQKSLDDYVDVAERITEFYDRYPDGSLTAADPRKPYEVALMDGFDKNGERITQTFIVYSALAYRRPDDPAPGSGTAWEVFPGRTPYTRGSELMNAETSAWGRALAALGIATKRGIASRQEVMAARDRNAETVNDDPEHKALRRGAAYGTKTPEDRGKVTRHTTAPGDEAQWSGGPVEMDPKAIRPRQLAALQAHYAKVSRDDRLQAVGLMIGREIGSFSDLTFDEASHVLDMNARQETGK